MSYSTAIADRIEQFLKADDWGYLLDTKNEVIRTGMTLQCRLEKVNIVFDLREDKYIVYCLCPLVVSEEKRGEIALLLSHINYSLMFGSFEMDPVDGDLRFRNAVDCDNCLPSQEVIQNSLYHSVVSFDRFGDAIVEVLTGESTPEEAFQKYA